MHFAMLGTTVYAPTAAILCQFREVSLRPRCGRAARRTDLLRVALTYASAAQGAIGVRPLHT